MLAVDGGTSKGYGRVCYDGRRVAAHRVACDLIGKPVPQDLNGCHSCDNPICANPAHVFAGTQKDNMQDWTAKGKNKLIEGTAKPFTHWMKKDFGKKLISNARRTEWSAGRRIVVRGSQGRIMGTRMVNK